MAESIIKIKKESIVTLVEITAKNVKDICSLTVTDSQIEFIASNALSIAQAYFEPNAWFSGIYIENAIPIGFVMLAMDPPLGEYYLWRFMVDSRYQKLGFAQKAMKEIINFVQVKSKSINIPVKEFTLSVLPKNIEAIKLYEKTGWLKTDKKDNEEIIYEYNF